MKEGQWLKDAKKNGLIISDWPTQPKAAKYRNRKVVVGGIKFDSQKEGRRYVELLEMQKVGYIRDLKLQFRFPLKVNGELVCTYVADFRYEEERPEVGQWTLIVEDVKSEFTRKNPVYRIKKKLLKALLSIDIRET